MSPVSLLRNRARNAMDSWIAHLLARSKRAASYKSRNRGTRMNSIPSRVETSVALDGFGTPVILTLSPMPTTTRMNSGAPP